MKAMELYDILTLEDDKDYMISAMTTYNNAEYLYLIEVDQDENIVDDNQKTVRRVIVEGEESVELVIDQDELAQVNSIFFDLFKEMAMDEETSEKLVFFFSRQKKKLGVRFLWVIK